MFARDVLEEIMPAIRLSPLFRQGMGMKRLRRHLRSIYCPAVSLFPSFLGLILDVFITFCVSGYLIIAPLMIPRHDVLTLYVFLQVW